MGVQLDEGVALAVHNLRYRDAVPRSALIWRCMRLSAAAVKCLTVSTVSFPPAHLFRRLVTGLPVSLIPRTEAHSDTRRWESSHGELDDRTFVCLALHSQSQT